MLKVKVLKVNKILKLKIKIHNIFIIQMQSLNFLQKSKESMRIANEIAWYLQENLKDSTNFSTDCSTNCSTRHDTKHDIKHCTKHGTKHASMFGGSLKIFILLILFYILKMTIVITQNILDCSSISAMETLEFEIIFTFKVVDLRVFFNFQIESAQSDIG